MFVPVGWLILLVALSVGFLLCLLLLAWALCKTSSLLDNWEAAVCGAGEE